MQATTSACEIRRLSAEEFKKLAEVADGFVPDPLCSVAIVAEKDGETVGRVFLVSPAHVEGPWTAMTERGGMLGKRLMDAAEQTAKECGIKKVFAYGSSERLEQMLAFLGYKRERLTVWTKEL